MVTITHNPCANSVNKLTDVTPVTQEASCRGNLLLQDADKVCSWSVLYKRIRLVIHSCSNVPPELREHASAVILNAEAQIMVARRPVLRTLHVLGVHGGPYLDVKNSVHGAGSSSK